MLVSKSLVTKTAVGLLRLQLFATDQLVSPNEKLVALQPGYSCDRNGKLLQSVQMLQLVSLIPTGQHFHSRKRALVISQLTAGC